MKAPEFLRSEPPTSKSDCYSLAVLMWQAITRETPFASVHPHTVIFQVGIIISSFPCRRTELQEVSERFI